MEKCTPHSFANGSTEIKSTHLGVSLAISATCMTFTKLLNLWKHPLL